MNRRVIATTVLALLGMALCTAPGGAGTWAGQETTKDGVVHVTSPTTPSEGASTLTPQELWNVGGDDEEVIFGVIRDIDIDAKGNVYLLDVQLNQVHVFDRDGQFLRAIGREGEGPGEFRRPTTFFVTAEGKVAVVQGMPGKILLLNPDGTPAGDVRTPEAPDGGMRMFADAGRAGNSIVLITREFIRGDNSMKETRSIELLDQTGALRATILSDTQTRDMGTMQFDEKKLRSAVWAASRDGHVYVADNFDAYRIKRYTSAGTLDRVFEREYAHRQRTKDEVEQNKPRIRFRTDGGASHSPNVTGSETDPDVLRMFARENGELWVLSSRGAFEPGKGAFVSLDVFDANGRFVRQTAFQVDGSFRRDGIELSGDHLFVVRELRSAERAMMAADDADATADEAAEPMSVSCYRLTPLAAARK